MRSFLIQASVAVAFAATMIAETTDANAVNRAADFYREDCARPKGIAVVAKPPVAACRYIVVNGVRVRQ